MMQSVLKIPLLILLLFVITVTDAKDDGQYLLTEKSYKVLSAAQDLMAAEKYSEAETKLNSLLKQAEPESYTLAVVQQTLGYLYSSTENYKKASEAFQQALDSKALPEKVSQNLRYNLAQLLLVDERYKDGIELLEKWLTTESSPPNSAHVLLASAYYRIENYQKTIEHIHIAIENDPSAKEAWYQVLLSAHLELKQYKSAIKVLEILVENYPYQKTYWAQLSALYLQQNKEFAALAVKTLAQRLELGDAKTLINLSEMYRYLHIPYKSAQLLTDAIDRGVIKADFTNLTALAESWLAAKEQQQAAAVFQQLAELDDSGKSDLNYARVLTSMEQWQQSIEPLMQSLKKLKGEQVGTASLLLGMAQFHLGNLAQAKSLFSNAVAFENERNQAGQWLRYIDKQLEGETDGES